MYIIYTIMFSFPFSSTTFQNREYLQHNANSIMKENATESYKETGANPYYDKLFSVPGDNIPYLLKSSFDNGKFGRTYPNSDLKNNYRSKQQKSIRLISPLVYPPPTSAFTSPYKEMNNII